MHEDGDCCTATCFGLTCSSFYSILKSNYPDPINIKDEEVVAWDGKGLHTNAPWEADPFWLPNGVSMYWLGGLLEGFMGPEYRMLEYRRVGFLGRRRPRRPVYLRRSVYGEGGTASRKEKELEERYADHQLAIDWAERMSRYTSHECSNQILRLAPNPFGKGETWYDEVWKEIGELPYDLPWEVEDFWINTFACERLEEQWIWRAYSEWIDMIGF
jgi:hypothetical protein